MALRGAELKAAMAGAGRGIAQNMSPGADGGMTAFMGLTVVNPVAEQAAPATTPVLDPSTPGVP